MFNVGGGEVLVIALVALLVLGPQRLPEAARTVGKVVGEVRRLSTGFQREVRDAFEVDEKLDARTSRREALPLASVVADVDAGDAQDDDAGATPLDPTDGVAPEVGEALDQIVAVPDLPADGTPATADGAPAAAGAAASADAEATETAGAADPVPEAPERPDIAAAADRTDEIAGAAGVADRDDTPGDARAAS